MRVSFGKNSAKNGIPKSRVFVCVALFSIFFLIIAYRALDLQFIDTEKAFNYAKKQQVGYLTLKSKRGGIFDSVGVLIASSKRSHSAYLIPSDIEDPEQFSRALEKIAGFDYERILPLAGKSNRSFIWLQRKMPEEIFKKLKKADLKGLAFISEQQRVYPQGNLLGPVVGFADTDLRGIEGLEYSLNRHLTGKGIKVRVKRDGRGGSMLFHNPNVLERTSGADVRLTVDSDIQYVVEEELKKGVERTGAQSGSAVLMEPRTGRILAMASYPFFDPNRFTDYLQVEQRNLPVWQAFEPGSIIKPFLVAAAIEEGLVSERTVFDCENGKRKIGSTEIRDSSPHGKLTVTDTIVFSSNICSSKIAELAGPEIYHKYLLAFGLGAQSGTKLPGEHRGIIPRPNQWGRIELATISFGQGLTVNALQMATAVSAIANGGYLMAPYIVESVADTGGNLIIRRSPKVKDRVISYNVARTMAGIMEQVVERGTGRRAAVRGYSVAGKTGTAQIARSAAKGYLKGEYVSSFLGFAPVEDPQMTLVIIINRPKRFKYGSQAAAPIFSAIAKRTLGMFEVRAASNGSTLAEKPFSMPDLHGKSVREVAQWAGQAGVNLRISGHGFAVKQTPSAGSLIKKGLKCSVSFSGDFI
ncbi:MAG: hypothetical protein GKS04_00335 [Candidatus Mycalebacterium zealandia]|nr:MAG: hypothetical protein GKS04_00335 [Candidatus Mycalebacterium zealandia]